MPIYPYHKAMTKTAYDISHRPIPGRQIENESGRAPYEVQFQMEFKLKNTHLNMPALRTGNGEFLTEEVLNKTSAMWIPDDSGIIFSHVDACRELTAAILHCLPIEWPPRNLHEIVKQALMVARNWIKAGCFEKSYAFIIDITQSDSYVFQDFPGAEAPWGMVPGSNVPLEVLPKGVLIGEEVEGDECPICLVKFKSGSSITLMPCFHTFHDECLKRWLLIRDTCPICRHQLPQAYVDIKLIR